MELVINEPLNENKQAMSLYGVTTIEEFVAKVVPERFTGNFCLRPAINVPVFQMWMNHEKTPAFLQGERAIVSAKERGVLYLSQVEGIYINEFEEECEIILAT